MRRPITERIAQVHVDRLVLRNVDLDPHGIRSLSHQIAAELTRDARDRAPGGRSRAPSRIAAEIAHHIRVTIEQRSPRPP